MEISSESIVCPTALRRTLSATIRKLCRITNRPAPRAKQRNPTATIAAIFRLKPPGENGQTITLLWTKDGNYWKVVSWDVEPEDAKPVKKFPTPADCQAGRCGRIHQRRRRVSGSDQRISAIVVGQQEVRRGHQLLFSTQLCLCRSLFAARTAAPKTPAQYSGYLRDALTTIDQDVGDSQEFTRHGRAGRP